MECWVKKHIINQHNGMPDHHRLLNSDMKAEITIRPAVKSLEFRRKYASVGVRFRSWLTVDSRMTDSAINSAS